MCTPPRYAVPRRTVLRHGGHRYGCRVQNTSLLTRPVWAFLLDAVCVLAFAAGGRSSHEEALSLGGVAQTAWPFLVGLGVGWLVLLAAAHRGSRGPRGGSRRGHLSVLPAGVVLVLASWGLGMGLRLLTEQGASGAFPLVALAFLTLTLIGWRLVAAGVSRRAQRRSSAPTP